MHSDRNQSALGLRTLVVGASSGIGRELAKQLVGAGAYVAAAARRTKRIAAIPGVVALFCDVRDPEDCDAVVSDASDRLGGLDAVVYASSLTKITPLERARAAHWRAVFETNLLGAALVTRAAIPHLTAPGSQGRALFLTSDWAESAFPGLVAYAASKAALTCFCQGLAEEFPALNVTEVVVGPAAGTEVADGFDPVDFAEWAVRWFEGDFVRHNRQQPATIASTILDALLRDTPPGRVLAAASSEARPSALEEGRHREAE
jgi:NAD(P)-dependent dehydrogenase (short-subunit alcohol dehydrogenase family)